MIEHILDTGDTGRLKIEDRTDEASKNVELWVQSLSPVSIPDLPWTYSINSSRSSWKSFNFVDTTMWQRLAEVYAGTNETFTLHLGDTGTSQLNGPTDHQINLAGYIPSTSGPTGSGQVVIKAGGVYKNATPYVKHNGVWKIAQPFVRGERGWTEV